VVLRGRVSRAGTYVRHGIDQAGLPRFTSSFHDPEIHELELTWDHGLTIHIDLTRWDIEPIDDWDRASILGLPLPCGCELHVTAHGSSEDPRVQTSPPGVVIHRAPALHPDDNTVLNGLPVTSPSRTLIDLAEVMPAEELRDAFLRFHALGLLDPKTLLAARTRVEWRPSLAVLDEVLEEFCG
jgi:hypothetical protein